MYNSVAVFTEILKKKHQLISWHEPKYCLQETFPQYAKVLAKFYTESYILIWGAVSK
jgi:hypothetical protein